MLARQNKTKREMHQPKKSDNGLIECKFLNARVLLGLFMYLCKFTLTNSFVRSSCANKDKNLTTKLINFKGRRNFSCTCLTSMPRGRKQPRTRFRMNKPRRTLVFTNLPLSVPSLILRLVHFSFCFVLFCQHAIEIIANYRVGKLSV